MTNSVLHPLQHELIAACRILDGEGLTTAFGHLSARTNRGGDEILISSNAGPGLVMQPSDLLRVGLDGALLDGDSGLLPGELAIHLSIYRAWPEVESVCRFHGPCCLAYSTRGRPLQATIGLGLFLGHQVPWFDTDSTVRTDAHGDRLADTLAGAPAVLLRGFGAVTVGTTVAEAVVRAWLLERQAAATVACGSWRALPYTAEAAVPFQAEAGPAPGQMARAWRWLYQRHNPVDMR